MAKGTINKRSVDTLKPGPSDVFLWDDKLSGFGMKLTPSGARTYVYQYRMGGRGTPTRRWTIGRHGDLTPDNARTLAEKLSFKVHSGVDPIEEERERKQRASTMAFSAYVETFTEGYLKVPPPDGWGSSWPQAKRQLEMYVVPILGDKALPDISVTDLNQVFDPLRLQPALRKNVFAVVRKLFNWALKRRDIAINPVAQMDAPKGAKSRKRVLSPDELLAIWRASFNLEHPRGHYVRSLITTLQRRSEVARLAWSELSMPKALWDMPGERAKNGQEHLVPLSDIAVAQFEDLGWRARGLVFPSSTGRTAISNFSDIKEQLDRDLPAILQGLMDKRADELGEDRHTVVLRPWRLHDIRRTGTTQMQALGFPIEVTERVINHHEGGEAAGIRGVYNLYEYLPEKTLALKAWGAWLENLVSGSPPASNVVQIASARP